MKKIAILTQPLGHNYGGSIQNYALQSVLKENGYNVETINRVNKNPHSKIKILLSTVKNIILKKVLKQKIFTVEDQQKISKNHKDFIKNNIVLSKKIDDTKGLKKYFKQNKFDTVIVGSDQTWRPDYSPNISNYFLDFLKDNDTIRKIAYATSFGTENWKFSNEETKKCALLAKKFDAVSVREESAVSLSKKYFGINSVWVLDPTMLLSKEDYLKIAQKGKISHRTGLFSYILDENPPIVDIIEHVKDSLKLDSFTNQPVCRGKYMQSDKLEDYIYPPVEGWLMAFHHADFIVTNSFHGTVFSIIFNKPFLAIVNKERGASRFYSLLEQFGLEKRLIDEKEENTRINHILNQPIDYKYVNLKLKQLKKESLDFLFSNLK